MGPRLFGLFFLCTVFFLGVTCTPEEEQGRSTGYPESLDGIHAEAFFEEGLRGKGVKIGILDIGFAGLFNDTALSHLKANGQLAYLDDLCQENENSFWSSAHGTLVLKYMAGMNQDDTLYKGSLARDATFYLIRPVSGAGAKEDSRKDEARIDSAFGILHAQGVRLVNLSLGFWNDYSDQDENYSPEQMDGSSTLITGICRKWADSGMIIVNSAGNTGEYAWRFIWAPGDAREVITVGGSRFPGMVFKASYSGIGNPDVVFVKPDLITYTPWGTSLTAPVITGMIACMLQKKSTLDRTTIQSLLHQASSLYPYPNHFVGYGIPDARKVLLLLADSTMNLSTVTTAHVNGDHFTLPVMHQPVVVFNKKGPYSVSRQTIYHPEDSVFTVIRKRGISRTTVAVGLDHAWEIFWE